MALDRQTKMAHLRDRLDTDSSTQCSSGSSYYHGVVLLDGEPSDDIAMGYSPNPGRRMESRSNAYIVPLPNGGYHLHFIF